METKKTKTKTKILEKDKIFYFKLGLEISGIKLSDEECKLFCFVYEEIIKKGNKFSVLDAIKLKLKLDKTKKVEKVEKSKKSNNWDSHLK